MKLLRVLSFTVIIAFAGVTIANAQSKSKDRKAARIAEVKQIIEDQNFVFDANYVNPTRSAGRSLTSSYDLTITKDTIICYLPYFGRAYVAPPYGSSDGGIKFTNTNFSYVLKAGKKDGWSVTIKPKDKNIGKWNDVQSMYLTISNDGYASLQVISSNRDPISFNGTIEKRSAKK